MTTSTQGAYMTPPIDKETLERIMSAEKEIVSAIGDRIGYGRTMQLCEEVWHEKEIVAGRENASGAHTTGPCRAFMVPCKHEIKDAAGHCDICCGAGRVTKGVAKLTAQLADRDALIVRQGELLERARLPRNENGKCSDLALVQAVADYIGSGISDTGKGTLDTVNRIIDLVERKTLAALQPSAAKDAGDGEIG